MAATTHFLHIMEPANDDGALEAATGLLSGRWKFVILWHLLAGDLHSDDLHRLVPHAASKALSLQLQDLERCGLVQRTGRADERSGGDYAITPLGRTLEPIILALEDWGERYDQSHRRDGVGDAARLNGPPGGQTVKASRAAGTGRFLQTGYRA